MAEVRRIEPSEPEIKPKKKVAAYARISMESERMNHSLSAQISYYSSLIQKNPDWQYAGVYADDGISGTGIAKREAFQKMIQAAENGDIDIILTKSIQRFARNTVDLLETVRHLKDIGVEVRFEKENIYSMSSDGELMLTILASFAQEESRSTSDNVKWGTRKRMQQGIPNGHFRIYGYEWKDDTLVIVPEEAAVVRRIFQNFLDGKSRLETERELETEGIRTRQGCVMRDSNIKRILTNVTYTGNLLLQKEFVEDPITKKRKQNHGELPQYWVENTHEPIIDMETFRYVQDEMARRRELGPLANKSLNISGFTGKIKCPYCGCSYTHGMRKPKNEHCRTIEIWTCGSKKKGGGRCPVGGSINQENMEKVLADVLGTEEFDEETFLQEVDVIYVPKPYTLEIHLSDGRTVTRECPNTGHKDCWTDELKSRTSAYRRTHGADIRSDYTVFTKKIRCAACGCNFRKDTDQLSDGRTVVHWRCPTPGSVCGTPTLREDVLKEMTAEVLGIDAFDDSVFLERVNHMDISSDGELIYHFTNGETAVRQWEKPKKVMPPCSEKQKEHMRQIMKKRWTPEKRAEQSTKMKELRKERGSNWRREK